MRKFALVAGFLVLYIALDAASFIRPFHGLNITPWNPAPALGLVFALRYPGLKWWWAAAVVLSEWVVRGISPNGLGSLVSTLMLAGGYQLLARIIARQIGHNTLLDDRRTLARWMLSVALGTFLISVCYLISLRLFGMLPAGYWHVGVLQFWIGDSVGIAVVMPLLWWLSSERGRVLLHLMLGRLETSSYLLLSVAVLWIAFGFGGADGFKWFYLLFIPIVWAALRQGMAGAVLSASVLQVGVIVAVQWLNYSAVTIAELQTLSLALALVGFFVGSVVDEQRRTSEDLRQSLRLAAAGEMAGALAHELNQPLTALSAYASACEHLLKRGESGERLNAAIRGMLVESGRAGEVVRRLRDFFRTGATRLETVSLPSVVDNAVAPFRIQAERMGVRVTVLPLPEARLYADALQLEVVLRNLLSNALDAVLASGGADRWVQASGELLPGGRVMLCVEDSGKGLSDRQVAALFQPFESGKSSGLGLGLVISRAIVETHGGSLHAEVGNRGVFRVILPCHEGL